ncbi:MAG: RidA family protein [Burkholderiales bacterium]|nr:RidA family protein [Burkholderiales bacterium]
MQEGDAGIERVDFWYPPELKELGGAPTGCRAGELLFLSGQYPRNPANGEPIRKLWDLPAHAVEQLQTVEHRDGREGHIKAQTWIIYDNIARILRSQGSSFDHVIRQGIYLRDASDMGPMEEVMLGFYGERRPATTISGMSMEGVHPEYLIQVEIVALVPQADGMEVEPINVPELAAVTAPYPQAVRVGQLVFLSGLRGINPRTGRLARTFDDVDAQTRKLLETGRYHTDTGEESLKVQTALTHLHMKRVLEHAGGQIADIVNLRQICAVGPKHTGRIHPLRVHFMGTTKAESPCRTSFYVPSLGQEEGLAILYDGAALLPGKWKKGGEVRPEFEMSHLPMTQRAGPYLFTTGYIAMDKSERGPVHSFRQINGAGRLLGFTRLDGDEPILAEAWHIYGVVAELLERAGSSMSRVVHQYVLLRNVSHYAMVERVANVFYRGKLPATTIVGTVNIGAYPGLLLEVFCVALIN